MAGKRAEQAERADAARNRRRVLDAADGCSPAAAPTR